MLAGTAASVTVALANDRRRVPAVSGPTPLPALAYAPALANGSAAGTITRPRDLRGRLGLAALIGAAVLLFAGAMPVIPALITNVRSSSSTLAPAYGPPAGLRSGGGASGNWERSYSVAQPSAGQMGAALLAAAEEQRKWDVMKAMRIIADRQDAAAAAAGAGSDAAAGWQPGAPSFSLNQASGIAPGTVIPARITVYGCTGPGGGFCNRMSSGGAPFEGAAACSSNLPFGTKLTIAGDPTGRVYECLDRGALAATWIDIYFENTSDGIAWQSQLGGTVAEITIVN